MIGPSGCGKSTLLRSVNRLNDLIDTVHVTGDMLLAGDSIYHPSVDVIELRKRMGMVFQKSNPFPMSIYENVVYSLRIDGERNKGVLDEVCEHSLRGAALWDEVKDRLHESGLSLSGGQQQRLCIARAIAARVSEVLFHVPGPSDRIQRHLRLYPISPFEKNRRLRNGTVRVKRWCVASTTLRLCEGDGCEF